MAREDPLHGEQRSDHCSSLENDLLPIIGTGGFVHANTVRKESSQGTMIRGEGVLVHGDPTHEEGAGESPEEAEELFHEDSRWDVH